MISGKELRDLRKRLGKTQKEVGDFIGVSIQAVSKYENEIVVEMPSDRIERLADCYGVTPAYLMGWTKSDITKAENIVNTMKNPESEEASKMYQKILDAGVRPEDVDEVINFAILVAKKKTAE